MEELAINKKTYSLFELNETIKSLINRAFPDTCRVTAEIAELKCNQRGHCYLELVEKQDDRAIAQMKATIWAYEYRRISLGFEKATGESLRPGMKVLLLAGVTFHELYGLSLNIRDIDPTYTIGEMARKKKEALERLKKEGLINLNKALPLPLVPQRIAVISSATAAGYEDFFNQLDKNPFGYRFTHVLFPALMQGREAEESIISALDEIRKRKKSFDVAVIIRGGGSAIDLNCFDGYAVASRAAGFPLPVITGIGHEKDDTVVDIVAHTRMKTPTAVAEFLISGVRGFEENIMGLHNRIQTYAERFLKDGGFQLNAVMQRLAFIPLRIAGSHYNRILLLQRELASRIRQLFQKEDNRFEIMELAVRHLDPSNILRRGYSITRHKGRILRDASRLKKWAVIETALHTGTITSIVQDKKEVKGREQGQTDNLLPGID